MSDSFKNSDEGSNFTIPKLSTRQDNHQNKVERRRAICERFTVQQVIVNRAPVDKAVVVNGLIPHFAINDARLTTTIRNGS